MTSEGVARNMTFKPRHKVGKGRAKTQIDEDYPWQRPLGPEAACAWEQSGLWKEGGSLGEETESESGQPASYWTFS